MPWTGWRGANRDGRVPWLPDELRGEANRLWTLPTSGDGLAGVVATEELVFIADRGATDTNDVWRCVDAATGLELWRVVYPAAGRLDYGNSPRATPLIHGDFIFFQGAFGHLHCVEIATGGVLWEKDLLAEFGAELPTWGLCSSPLIADGKLIICAGGLEAFLVALDPLSGDVVWKTPGREPAYASFVAAKLGGVAQLVGYDNTTLGGWDVKSGKRLWELAPPVAGDFNVPTPVVVGEQLLVTSENNGTRLYGFGDNGRIVAQPVGHHHDLAPDSSTPVLVDGRVFGVWANLFCLDVADGLKEKWTGRIDRLREYASAIAAPGRVLITTTKGQLVLVDARADSFQQLGRQQVVADESEVHSHPALVGTRLYVRSATTLMCVELGGSAD